MNWIQKDRLEEGKKRRGKEEGDKEGRRRKGRKVG